MLKKLRNTLLLLASAGLLSACFEQQNLEPTKSQAELAARLAVPPTTEMLAIDDGPYAIYTESNNAVELYWLCSNEVVTYQQPINQLVPVECGYAKEIQLRPAPAPNPIAHFSAPKIAAVSDIHGQFGVFLELLINNHIITDTWNWNFGDGHLVIVGDVFDRGPQQTEILWLLYQLEQQALESGGQVHMLLGNHETMVLYDDLRYLNSKYENVAEKFGRSFPELYGPDTVLGAWLRSLPVIITVNDMIFMHGGLHTDFLDLNMSITEVNDTFRQSLGMSRAALKEDPLLDFLYRSKGPIWYRGYFRDSNPINDEMLNTLLEALSVKHIVVGHTSFTGVFEHWNGRVFSVDSNIKRGESGEVLFWEDGKFTRGTFSGEQTSVPTWVENKP